MNRPNRSLHLVGSLAAALAGAAAVTGLSPAAQAQIVFDTVNWPLSPQPTSTATAISTFDGLAGTSDIGCLSVASLNGLNNQSVPGGGSSNIGYHEAVVFVVGPTQAGTWQFRWGADFGRGGTLLVDGVELQSRWTDMWWDGGFTRPDPVPGGHGEPHRRHAHRRGVRVRGLLRRPRQRPVPVARQPDLAGHLDGQSDGRPPGLRQRRACW